MSRLLDVQGLECNEGVLTGESATAVKSVEPVPRRNGVGHCTDLAFMGTIVSAGEGHRRGVRHRIGRGVREDRGGSGHHLPETDFQAGLRRFSYLLLYVAITTDGAHLGHQPAAAARHRVGVVRAGDRRGHHPSCCPRWSAALAAGSRQLAKRKVLVKRLVCIEDLGDIDILITDKTGTLTEGTSASSTPSTRAGDLGGRAAAGTAGHRRRPGRRRASGNDMDAALGITSRWAGLTAGITGSPNCRSTTPGARLRV